MISICWPACGAGGTPSRRRLIDPWQPCVSFAGSESRTDFLERRSLDAFSRNFQKDAAVHFPAPIADLSSRRVLTMELLEGIRGLELKVATVVEITPDELALKAARVYLQMIFQDGFYHADPHPGNYLVLQGGVLGILDAGMVGRLDEDLRDRLEALIVAVYHRDAARLTDTITSLGSSPPTDAEGLRAEVNEFVHDFADQPLGEFDLSAALNRMTDIIRRFGILLPPEVALLLRTLVVLEGSARQLSPTFSLAEVINLYVREHGVGQLWKRFRRKMQRSVRDWDRFLTDLPRELDEIIKRFREGKLEIHHEVKGIERTVNRLVRGIIAAALIMGSSMPEFEDPAGDLRDLRFRRARLCHRDSWPTDLSDRRRNELASLRPVGRLEQPRDKISGQNENVRGVRRCRHRDCGEVLRRLERVDNLPAGQVDIMHLVARSAHDGVLVVIDQDNKVDAPFPGRDDLGRLRWVRRVKNMQLGSSVLITCPDNQLPVGRQDRLFRRGLEGHSRLAGLQVVEDRVIVRLAWTAINVLPSAVKPCRFSVDLID